MNQRDDAFAPETVDEHIDQLLRAGPPQEDGSPAQMVQMIQGFYKEDPRLQRVWERLAAHRSTPPSIKNTSPSPLVRFPQERLGNMQTQIRPPEAARQRNIFRRHLGQLVAVLLLAVLVGSLVTALRLAHQQSAGQTGAPQVSPTAGSKPGQVIYSSPQQKGWVSGLAWSADGQRVAIVGSETHIWDATTGQHNVTLSLTPSPIAGPAWSPKSDLLAIPTSNSILIVDGQSGKTLISYAAPAATAMTSSTGMASLVGLMPLGGAPNFGGVAWSPDGKLIASTFSSATSAGVVQVWDSQTGQLAYTLAVEAGWGFGAIAWSPDGQYLAATAWKWDGSVDQLNVWSVSTRQIVFQQSGNQEFYGVSWQPGSDNLASALLKDNAFNSAVLHLWNVTTKQVIKTFPGVAGVSWSPDGKEFVYSDLSGSEKAASVTILDVNSGKKVYTYQVSEAAALRVTLGGVWSPTGTSIMTVESIEPAQAASPLPQQSYVIKVWQV